MCRRWTTCAVSVCVYGTAQSGSARVWARVSESSCERAASYASVDFVSTENLSLPSEVQTEATHRKRRYDKIPRRRGSYILSLSPLQYSTLNVGLSCIGRSQRGERRASGGPAPQAAGKPPDGGGLALRACLVLGDGRRPLLRAAGKRSESGFATVSHCSLSPRLPGSSAASLRWSATCHPELRPARGWA